MFINLLWTRFALARELGARSKARADRVCNNTELGIHRGKTQQRGYLGSSAAGGQHDYTLTLHRIMRLPEQISNRSPATMGGCTSDWFYTWLPEGLELQQVQLECSETGRGQRVHNYTYMCFISGLGGSAQHER